MLILGVDICANRAVVWPLSEVPKDPKAHWRRESEGRSKDPKGDPLTFYFTKAGIAGLLALEPDAIAMEPTGVHYSRLLWHICEAKGIPIYWVGHQQASNQRKSYGLPDKNDIADAFAIACYAHLYKDHPSYFLEFPHEIRRIRELYLQLKTIARLQSPALSRLKQQLAFEWPEKVGADLSPYNGRRSLILWLCGRKRSGRKSMYWDNEHSKSIAGEYSIEISHFTRKLAEMIDDYDLWAMEIEKELSNLVNHPIFDKYNRVFDEFNFGLRLRAILLSLVYPFDRFESIGAFKRRIGATRDEVSSGKSIAWKTGTGSKLCRTELYLWVYTSICGKANRPRSEVGKLVSAKYDGWIERASDPEQVEAFIRAKMQQDALEQVKAAFFRAVKPLIPVSEKERFDSVMNLMEISLKASISENTDKDKIKLNRKEAKRRMQNLVMSKTANFAARWLYRRLKATIA
ncbi:transposase [Pannus brasiliensis CCIBt3594]|uniref:Transposase n=1 Tax=Pannus brasiliensis CCIBt3594 TaxID=1427578 RepID=A0AAW9QT75_9CHRO